MVGARTRLGLVRAVLAGFVATLAVAMAVAVPLAAFGAPGRVDAIKLALGDAPIALQSADPHHGAGDGVVDADTQGQTKVEGSNNIVLLVAALGVLIGVLVVTRSKPGPRS
jgi:hypothetical protein